MSVFHNPRMVTDPLLDENMPRTSKDKNKTSDVLLYMYCLGHTSHVGSEKNMVSKKYWMQKSFLIW